MLCQRQDSMDISLSSSTTLVPNRNLLTTSRLIAVKFVQTSMAPRGRSVNSIQPTCQIIEWLRQLLTPFQRELLAVRRRGSNITDYLLNINMLYCHCEHAYSCASVQPHSAADIAEDCSSCLKCCSVFCHASVFWKCCDLGKTSRRSK